MNLSESYKRRLQELSGLIEEISISDEFVYHGTNYGAAYHIQIHGGMKLNSANNNEPYISFTSDLAVARYYANMKGGSYSGIILRTKRTPDFSLSPKFEKNDGYEWITKREIPLKELEIKTMERWVPLEQYDIISRKVIQENQKGYSKNIWYHGSNNNFITFELIDNKTYKEIDLPVWFFTKDLDYAKTYGKYIYKVELNIKNTFDTSNKTHFEMFIEYLKQYKKTNDEINAILDEQFYKELPYWTCDDSYYCAISNDFDSVLIAEELEKEVESIGVFDKNKIKILKVFSNALNENKYPNMDTMLSKYKLRCPKDNVLIKVNINKLFARHAKDEPNFAFSTKEKSDHPDRVDRVKRFWHDFSNDSRYINPKTKKRTDWGDATFEAPYITIDDGRLGFSDGRHRVVAMKELGYDDIIIEVPKEQVKLFDELK